MFSHDDTYVHTHTHPTHPPTEVLISWNACYYCYYYYYYYYDDDDDDDYDDCDDYDYDCDYDYDYYCPNAHLLMKTYKHDVNMYRHKLIACKKVSLK